MGQGLGLGLGFLGRGGGGGKVFRLGAVRRQDRGILEPCTKVNRGTPGYIEHKYKTSDPRTVQSDSSPRRSVTVTMRSCVSVSPGEG